MPLPSWLQKDKGSVIKGFIIAGTGSGSGKTTTSLAVMAHFFQEGYRVAPFKVGPDFIDPGHHRAVTGRISRNLDSWMLSKAYNRELFARGCKDADIAVVEGVMGLFDGYSGLSEAGSTAQMAKWLNLPVILVVDARSMARSVAAIIQGFENFDPDLTFAGVVFSKTGSPRHYDYLKEAVEANCRMKCLGHMPRNEVVTLPERHLGLVTSDEHTLSGEVTSQLTAMVRDNTVVSDLVKTLPDLDSAVVDRQDSTPVSKKNDITIAVARDKAFCFYYQDNLEFLERAGANVVTFSPLADSRLPGNIHGLYFGGGYPELFAKTLSKNKSLLNAIKEKSLSRMPIYGECGGFMYLCSEISGMDSEGPHAMAGCFPFSVMMSKKLRSLGYREVTVTTDTLVGSRGDVLRGHEFHYSSLKEIPKEKEDQERIEKVYQVTRRGKSDVQADGYQRGNTLGSYLHVHFGSNDNAGCQFVKRCRAYQQGLE